MSKGETQVAHARRVLVPAVVLAVAVSTISGARAQPAPSAPPRSAPAAPPRSAPEPGSRSIRYVSAQAYFQAMRAEMLAQRGDLDGAAEALALALVYDPESYHLHVELARVALGLGRGARVDRLVEQAIRIAPRRAAAWRLRGDAERADGRPVDAARAYTRALAVEPASADGVEAALALAALELGRGREARAREILVRASELSPRAVEARVRLELARGDREAASQAIEAAGALFAGDAALTRLGIEVHARAGRLERAWLLAIPGMLPDDAPTEGLLVAHAVALAAGHGDAAATLRARVLAREPDDTARMRLALALVAAGDAAGAREVAQGLSLDAPALRARAEAAATPGEAAEPGGPTAREDAPVVDPILGVTRAAQLHERLGRALWLAGDRARGRALLAGAPAVLIALLAGSGESAEAVVEARRVLADRSGVGPAASVAALGAAAVVLARAEGEAAATAALGTAVLATQAVMPRVLAAAEAEASVGRLDAASGRLDAARLRDPGGADRAAARIQARYGSLVRAERLAERLAGEGDAEMIALLGRLRAARRARLPATLAEVRRALGTAPDDPALLASAGRIAIALGRDDEGTRALARSAWIDGSDPAVLEHLGDARAKAGDASGARATYLRAQAELTLRVGASEPGAAARAQVLETKLRR